MNSIDYITPVSSPISNLPPIIYRLPKNRSMNDNIENENIHSISHITTRRRLDFTNIHPISIPLRILDDDTISLSPISLPSDDIESIGECGVCYEKLPLRSNHIFTICGHLFCVKCLLNWNNNSSTCPLCRENLYDKIISNHINQDNNVVDDIMFGERFNRLDRYIYDDIDIEWTESVYEDDDIIFISNTEINQLREVRHFVLTLIQRRMYLNSLFSNIEFDGKIYHSFIQRMNYTNLSENQMDKSFLYEFVICRDIYHDSDEINYFGYIEDIQIIDVLYLPFDEHQNWESTHEYSFKVRAFNPNIHNSIYEHENGLFQTTPMTFRFSEIRRLYSIWSITGIYD